MKCKKRNLVFIAGMTVVLLFYAFKGDGLSSALSALRGARPGWITAAFALMGAYWLLEALILHIAVKRSHAGQHFCTTLQTTMIGQLFNCITPFASGGQPMQAYHMVQSGVPLGVSACALAVKFMIYQFVLTMYSMVTLVFKFREFSASISNLKYLVLLGFGVNTAVILGLLSLCFFSGPTGRFVHWTISLLHRLKLVRDAQSAHTALDAQLRQFYTSFAMMRQHKMMMVRMALFSFLQLTVYFLIPYALFRSFGLSLVSVFSILAAQAFVLNVSSFVPLPGAAGGAELSFHVMFALFFPSQLLNVAILLWRLITFYLPICTGAIFTFGLTKKKTSTLPN